MKSARRAHSEAIGSVRGVAPFVAGLTRAALGGGSLLGVLALLGVADFFLGRRVVDGGVVDRCRAFFAVVGHGAAYPNTLRVSRKWASGLAAQPLEFVAFATPGP